MPGFAELYMDRGTTFSRTLNIADDTTGANTNIADYTIRGQMRRSYYSANASLAFTCTISDAANGVIVVSANANTTANLKVGRYVYDIEAVTGQGVTVRLLEGYITVTPDVTR